MARHRFQDTFNRNFTQGARIGASNFQIQERERIDIKKEQARIREKRREKNEKDKVLQRALGVDVGDPAQFDTLTKQPKRNADKQQPSFDRSFDIIKPIEQNTGDGTPSSTEDRF